MTLLMRVNAQSPTKQNKTKMCLLYVFIAAGLFSLVATYGLVAAIAL